MRKNDFRPAGFRTSRAAPSGRQQILIALLALAAVLVTIQFISTAFEHQNARAQAQRALDDGDAPPRDPPKGL